MGVSASLDPQTLPEPPQSRWRRPSHMRSPLRDVAPFHPLQLMADVGEGNTGEIACSRQGHHRCNGRVTGLRGSLGTGGVGRLGGRGGGC